MSGKDKEDTFRRIYLRALQERGGTIYTYPFAMRNQHHCVIYWLFFCTNNILGLKEMKKAMWQVDRSDGFEFSDKHSTQIGMFSYKTEELAKDLTDSLAGRTMTVP